MTAVISALSYRYLKRSINPVVLAVAHVQKITERDIHGKLARKIDVNLEDLPHKLDFEVDDQARWMITEVRIRGMRRPSLTTTAQRIKNYRGFEWLRSDGPWHRRITFDPPVGNGWVLLHREEVHGSFTALFTVRLRAEPKARFRVSVRCSVLTDEMETLRI